MRKDVEGCVDVQRERGRERERRRIKGKSGGVFDRKRKIISLEVSRQTCQESVLRRGVD